MALFDEQLPPPEEKADQQDYKMAATLHGALLRSRKAKRQWNRGAWASEFCRLRTLDGVTRGRIEQVVRWYVSNIGKQYVPAAYSAKSFRKKFSALWDALKRGEDETVPENVQIEKRVALLSRRLRFNWPLGEEKDQERLLQVTVNRYGDFLAKLRDIAEPCGRPGSVGSIASLLRVFLVKDVLDAARRWLEMVNDVAWNWSEWDGNLMSWVWSIRHKKVRQSMIDILAEHTDRERAAKWWDLLSKQV